MFSSLFPAQRTCPSQPKVVLLHVPFPPQCGDPQAALQVFREMKLGGVQPDVVAYTSLLTALHGTPKVGAPSLVRCGWIEEGSQVLRHTWQACMLVLRVVGATRQSVPPVLAFSLLALTLLGKQQQHALPVCLCPPSLPRHPRRCSCEPACAAAANCKLTSVNAPCNSAAGGGHGTAAVGQHGRGRRATQWHGCSSILGDSVDGGRN